MNKIWTCKIGELDERLLPDAADWPMRRAIAIAYRSLTGCDPKFLFSGWDGELTPGERAVVNTPFVGAVDPVDGVVTE